MLLKNKKLQVICRINADIVIASVTRYTLLTILPVFDLERDHISIKKGLILIQATML